MTLRVVRRSYRRAGRLVPPASRRLRSRSMILKPGQSVEWHSTGSREELLIGISGTVTLEYRACPPRQTQRRRDGPRRIRRATLPAGGCLFLPHRIEHRVVNRASRMAHYIYLTG